MKTAKRRVKRSEVKQWVPVFQPWASLVAHGMKNIIAVQGRISSRSRVMIYANSRRLSKTIRAGIMDTEWGLSTYDEDRESEAINGDVFRRNQIAKTVEIALRTEEIQEDLSKCGLPIKYGFMHEKTQFSKFIAEATIKDCVQRQDIPPKQWKRYARHCDALPSDWYLILSDIVKIEPRTPTKVELSPRLSVTMRAGHKQHIRD